MGFFENLAMNGQAAEKIWVDEAVNIRNKEINMAKINLNNAYLAQMNDEALSIHRSIGQLAINKQSKEELYKKLADFTEELTKVVKK